MLHEALRLIRVYHDASQTQLSIQLEISNSHLSEVESGKKQPSLELLRRYSAHFDIPLSSLMFFAENLGTPKIPDRLRALTARKIIELLQWVEQKDEYRAAQGGKM